MSFVEHENIIFAGMLRARAVLRESATLSPDVVAGKNGAPDRHFLSVEPEVFLRLAEEAKTDLAKSFLSGDDNSIFFCFGTLMQFCNEMIQNKVLVFDREGENCGQ